MFMAMLYTLYQKPGLMIALLLVISIWSLIWKGIALWYSAQRKQKKWYIAILIINSLGILPILYLLIHNTNLDIKKSKD